MNQGLNMTGASKRVNGCAGCHVKHGVDETS